MKKYFLSIVALAGMLFATSCQESLVEPQMEGPATFTVQVPDQMGTKAIGSKANVNQLLVAVYQEAFDGAKAIHRQTAEVKNGVATISLNLIKGQSYDVIFWAQKDNGYVNVNTEFELVNIPVENKHHNDDNGAAFFFYKENFVPSGVAESVTLKRPFAQLNLGTTAESLITNAGTVAIETSAITVGNVATSFNTVLGYGQGEQTLVFAAKPEPQQELTVGNDDHYVYVSMDYLPISGDDEAVVTVEAQITLNNTQVVSHKFTNVPVRENYRTNIVGNLISSSSEFTVKVDDSWAGADYTEEYVAPGIRMVNGEYEITSEEGLWSLAEIVNGGTKALTASDFSGKTVKLTCDIDLKNEPWTPIGGVGLVHFSGVFDGNNHKISNLLVMPASDDDNSYKGLFGAARGIIKNLTLENVNVKGHSKVGALVGDGQNAKIEKCKVVGGSVTSTPANGLKGNNVGGLVGYLYADGKSETYAFVNNCSVENLTVKAYSDVAGLVGTVGCTSGSKEATVVGNTIKNVFVIADQSVQHNETRNPNAGEVYGRTAGDVDKIDISQNTTEEVIVSVIEKGVNIAEQIKDAQEGAVVAIPAGEYTTLPTPDNKITIVCVEGTVFKGKSSLNINGSTVIGATFKNDNGNAVSGSINAVLENCTIEGSNGLRGCYSTGIVKLENCIIKGSVYGIHFDGGNNEVYIDNCQIHGWNSFASTIENVTIKNSEFNKSGYGRLRFYQNAYVENCTFSEDFQGIDFGSGGNQNIGITVEFAGCSDNVKDLYTKGTNNKVIIDGDYYVASSAEFLSVCTDVLTDGTKDVKVVLGADIDLTGIEWPAVKTAAAFVLDGKGYSIKNLTTTAVESHGFYSTAMFTSTRKAATIKNLVVENATVTGNGGDNSHGAVLVACNYAALNIEGVTVKNSTVSNCDRSSVITTYLYFTNATVKNCVVEGCTVNSIGTAGALLGMNNGHNFEATGNTVKNTTISSSEGGNKAGILIGTWQNAGTLTESNNVVENSKAINAGTETNNNIGRHA